MQVLSSRNEGSLRFIGIGKAVALALGKAGADVVINNLDEIQVVG